MLATGRSRSPLLITPNGQASKDESATEAIRSHGWTQAKLFEHGALLFRGFVAWRQFGPKTVEKGPGNELSLLNITSDRAALLGFGEMSVDESIHPVGPFQSFREAASVVLQLLQDRVGMDLWLLTRTEGEDWIVLHAKDRGYNVKAGDVFRWSDSFCSRMVQELGPRIAPDSNQVPAYAEAPIAQQVPIAAYVGVPITRPDGSLFGTLCAIDPKKQPDSLRDHLPVIEVYTRLLATILNLEFESHAETRRAEIAEAESERDALTNLFNVRGWHRLRDAEEERCRRYGNPAGIVVADLDEFKSVNDEHGHAVGDETLKRAADVIRKTVRASDVIARLGGDEFVMLAIEETEAGLQRLAARVQTSLESASINASVGAALRAPKGSLKAAQACADAEMYAAKRAKSERSR